MKWFEDNNIVFLPWPSRSPDLNPMENIWGFLSRLVYGNNSQYLSVPDLKQSIVDAWNEMPISVVNKLVASMENRIFQLLIKMKVIRSIKCSITV